MAHVFEKLSWAELASRIDLSILPALPVWVDFGKREVQIGVGCALCLSASAGCCYAMRCRRPAERKRPYVRRNFAAGEYTKEPVQEMTKILEWLQDDVIRPLDARLPGRPFETDLLVFPFTPMVLLIGNHSAGKSTFVNQLIGGPPVMETGCAPTTDGFTVIERHPQHAGASAGPCEAEDGPTLLSCPENAAFRELQRFGQAFWGHLRRLRLRLPDDSGLPHGLQIVDTPGMIDLPEAQAVAKTCFGGGRGYNFTEAVRWFAKRADLIVLFFDPDKPGTTAETLDVLKIALKELDHKFLILLNKVDQLDSAVDFARAYGTLGWALSKVISRKDIPQIYTTYNAGAGVRAPSQSQTWAPLDAFQKKRDEVVAEVLRCKTRHWDNVITGTADTLRQVHMAATICDVVRSRLSRRRLLVQFGGLACVGCVVGGIVKGRRWEEMPLVAACAAACSSGMWALGYHLRCFHADQLTLESLETCFDEAYAKHLVHGEAVDLRSQWRALRGRVHQLLSAAARDSGHAASLTPVPPRQLARIDECLEKDIPHLRQLAQQARANERV